MTEAAPLPFSLFEGKAPTFVFSFALNSFGSNVLKPLFSIS